MALSTHWLKLTRYNYQYQGKYGPHDNDCLLTRFASRSIVFDPLAHYYDTNYFDHRVGFSSNNPKIHVVSSKCMSNATNSYLVVLGSRATCRPALFKAV